MMNPDEMPDEVQDEAQSNALHAEYERLAKALDNLDSGATIEGFTIGDAPVNAAGILFPPQMITAIREQLKKRQGQITDQLGEEPESGKEARTAPPAARTAPPAPEPRKPAHGHPNAKGRR